MFFVLLSWRQCRLKGRPANSCSIFSSCLYFSSSFFPSPRWMVEVDQGFQVGISTSLRPCFDIWSLVPTDRNDATLLLLRSSLSAQSRCFLHSVRLSAVVLHAVTLVQSCNVCCFQIICISLKMNFSCQFFFLELFHFFYECYFICFWRK